MLVQDDNAFLYLYFLKFLLETNIFKAIAFGNM